MKLIIDIPEEDREDICNIHFVREDLKFKVGKAIMNGTPFDSTEEYIKKSDLMAKVVTETLSDYTEDDVIYADVINSLPTYSLNKGEWIPVSERLPKVDQEVLATTKWGEVTIAERLDIGSDCWFINEGDSNAYTEDILAWQPLPEPYRAESEEK